MKKQTAVNFLIKFMEQNEYYIGNDLFEAFKKAKELEKQQLIESYYSCFQDENEEGDNVMFNARMNYLNTYQDETN